MRVCFYTLGCKVNLNETGALEQMFRANGFTIAQENEPADVFVVNSCTVTNFGDQKSRKWLRRKKRENPGAVTVLTGCYPQAFPEEAAQLPRPTLSAATATARPFWTMCSSCWTAMSASSPLPPTRRASSSRSCRWSGLRPTPALSSR